MSGYRRILVAFDGSEGAHAALEHAVELAKLHGSRLGVVAVVSDHASLGETMAATMGVPCPAPDQALPEELRAAVSELPPDQPVGFQVRVGDPVDELIAAAAQWQADLMVVGARRHRPTFSVSHRLLAASEVPVLVVRPAGDYANGPAAVRTAASSA